MTKENPLWDLEYLEQWERKNIEPMEVRRRMMDRRIEDLQDLHSLTPGEFMELEKLLSVKWDLIKSSIKPEDIQW